VTSTHAWSIFGTVYFLVIILNSVQFLCSQALILTGWRLETRLSTFDYYYYCSLLLRPISSQSHMAIDGRSASKSWCRSPSGDYYLTVTVLFFCGAPSLTRGRVCLLYMLLAFASAVFLGPESLGTRDHILLSQIWDFSFRRLLRLVGSRWRYSTPAPHGRLPIFRLCPCITLGTDHTENAACIDEACLPRRCLAIDVLLSQAYASRECLYRLVA
jgi:hypothetical protein